MSLLIVGTVPREDFPLVNGICRLSDEVLIIDDLRIDVRRGTPALLAAACITAKLLDIGEPIAVIVGDTGIGNGSKRLYEYLVRTAPFHEVNLIVFHYLQPDVDWHNRILITLEDLGNKPCLVADAGYMYVAKMSGFAGSYDLFTPDVGEMAFLADETAPHPFYTRGFLLQDEQRLPDLIARAYQHHNAAKYLLVKGECDYVASSDGIIAKICEPSTPNMEPIGGTGDTLTGIVAALIQAGHKIDIAAQWGAKINRLMGAICEPTPASSVLELLCFLPEAISELSLTTGR